MGLLAFGQESPCNAFEESLVSLQIEINQFNRHISPDTITFDVQRVKNIFRLFTIVYVTGTQNYILPYTTPTPSLCLSPVYLV